MEDTLTLFETAKLAKEKGFDIKTLYVWADFKLVPPRCRVVNTSEIFENEYYAPTQSLLQKWLREKHNLLVMLDTYTADYFTFKIYKLDKIVHILALNGRLINSASSYRKWDTYEEALEAGLLESLNLL